MAKHFLKGPFDSHGLQQRRSCRDAATATARFAEACRPQENLKKTKTIIHFALVAVVVAVAVAEP